MQRFLEMMVEPSGLEKNSSLAPWPAQLVQLFDMFPQPPPVVSSGRRGLRVARCGVATVRICWFSGNSFCLWLLLCLPSFGAAAEQAPLRHASSLVAQFEKFGLTPLAQGDRDVCSLFAITALAEYEYARQTTGPHARLSEEYLIWAAKRANGKTGDQAMFYEAVHGLNELGICPADEMRYTDKPDPHRKPSPVALAESQPLRKRWRVEWIKLWSLDSALTERESLEIKRALANGHPVACGLRWPKKLHGSELLAVPPPHEVFDGHSIALVGFEDDPTKPGGGVFLFRNSNGSAWGNHGYGTMSYAYVRTYANDALWLRLGPPGSEVPTIRYEAESMQVLAKAKSTTSSQSMSDFHASMWSGGRQLFCAAQRGGSIDLGFEVPAAGRYRIRVLATAAPDFGVIHASLDGKRVGPTFDLYAGRVCPTGPLELGEFHFQAGRHRIRISAVDKNAHSKNYFFGLDGVDLMAEK
jgi:hypothetical protein